MESVLTKTDCPSCGVAHAIPEKMYNNRKAKGGVWYCPNGHEIIFSRTLKDQLDDISKELERVKESKEYFAKESVKLEKSIIGYKGVIGKMKKKLQNS